MPLGTSLQVFSGQPIDEAAFLSSSAYGLPNQPNADDLKNRLLSQGWTLVTNLPGIGTDGYYSANKATQAGPATQLPENSVAFAAVKGDTVAISFRGTYIVPVPPNKNILQILERPFDSISETDLTQIAPDLEAAAFHPKAHYSDVAPFINEVIAYVKKTMQILKISPSPNFSLPVIVLADKPQNYLPPKPPAVGHKLRVLRMSSEMQYHRLTWGHSSQATCPSSPLSRLAYQAT